MVNPEDYRPVDDPEFWRKRLEWAQEHKVPYFSIWNCQYEQWQAMIKQHAGQLTKFINPDDRVLDAGCAYGRLVELMPHSWRGAYLGVDISPDFIEYARKLYPTRDFRVGDLRSLPTPEEPYDWAICVMVYDMIRHSLGADYWAEVEAELRRVAKQILILEPNVPGWIL